MVFTCSLISKPSSPWTKPLGTVPSLPITIGITVTFVLLLLLLLLLLLFHASFFYTCLNWWSSTGGRVMAGLFWAFEPILTILWFVWTRFLLWSRILLVFFYSMFMGTTNSTRWPVLFFLINTWLVFWPGSQNPFLLVQNIIIIIIIVVVVVVVVVVTTTTTTIIFSQCVFSYQFWLVVFHWSLSSTSLFKSPWLIYVDINITAIWMILIHPLISSSSNHFSRPLGTVPRASKTTDITVIFMIRCMFQSPSRSKYLSLFSHS